MEQIIKGLGFMDVIIKGLGFIDIEKYKKDMWGDCEPNCIWDMDTDIVEHTRNCIQNRTPWYKLKEFGGVV